MKVLILTGRFGLGHVSAAEAIRQESLMAGEDVEAVVVDMVEYLFPKISELIYRGFALLVTRLSYIYNKLNSMASAHSDVPLKKKMQKKVKMLIEKEKPDIIIATFPGCAQYIGEYKKITGDAVKLYTYVTDITIHMEWLAENTDLYFVGSEKTKSSMMENGVEASQIKISGIPVKQIFKIREAKSANNRRKNREVLIMGGGLGLIPHSDKLINSLIEAGGINITIIAGKNIKLKEAMETKFPEINVVGYTNKVDYYMKKADIIVTKSGGITTFEAINCGTPLYILTPFLMQEVGNAEFVEENGLGMVAWEKDRDISRDIIGILRDDVRLKEMKDAMSRVLESFDSTCPVTAFCEEEDDAV